jgi:hypothetical protein
MGNAWPRAERISTQRSKETKARPIAGAQSRQLSQNEEERKRGDKNDGGRKQARRFAPAPSPNPHHNLSALPSFRASAIFSSETPSVQSVVKIFSASLPLRTFTLKFFRH